MLSSLKYYRNTLFLQTQNKRLGFWGENWLKVAGAWSIFRKIRKIFALKGPLCPQNLLNMCFFCVFPSLRRRRQQQQKENDMKERAEEDGGGRRVMVGGNTE